MIGVLHHRGPDDTGFYVDNGIGLANARLSIIDLEGGHQPLSNEDGTVHVTYNGEIYNFRELRTTLESRGHKFHTKTDTEVIVHCYEEFGEGFPNQLNGMFAIALWDGQRKKMVLARDRMGIKPLYYTLREDQSILFASEMKAILQAPIQRSVDEISLYTVLNLGYIPGSSTLLKGIRKLSSSTILTYQSGETKESTYWAVPPASLNVNEDVLVEQLRVTLAESIRDQLVADVPVGCFLSGGLDTSVLVAFAARAMNQPLKTFCMGFGEETDEFKDARLIAERFGTDHREITVDSSDGVKLYPRMVWHMEVPKYNLYPWFVCELVRRDVKVCLSGNGGDELFGGYFARYENALRIEKLARVPVSAVLRGAGTALETTARSIRTKNRLRVLKSLGDSASEYLILAGVLPESMAHQLFLNYQSAPSLRDQYSKFFEGHDFLQGLMDAELRTKLVDDLLSVDDSMSMAHSLELRVPLLDNRLVDLMVQVPWQLKYRQGTNGKLVLRKAIREILPEETLRKPKWGFSVNVYSWYKGELGEIIRAVVPESDIISKYFSQSLIRNLIAKPLSPDNRRSYLLLWQLLGFHLWHRMFVDSEEMASPELDLECLLA